MQASRRHAGGGSLHALSGGPRALTIVIFVPANPTVIGTLTVCALSIAGAIFVILELDRPFGGLIRISNAPLREALAQLGR